jgi:CheY-like chemotaxis protein
LEVLDVRVLVVDDSPDVRFMLRILLEDAGMEVDEVTSGPAALERLLGDGDGAGFRPDAVVLDQRMPTMTGIEVLQELAAHGSNIPVILFSAYLHPDLQAEAERLGATPVTKSDLDELIDVIQRHLPLVA